MERDNGAKEMFFGAPQMFHGIFGIFEADGDTCLPQHERGEGHSRAPRGFYWVLVRWHSYNVRAFSPALSRRAAN